MKSTITPPAMVTRIDELGGGSVLAYAAVNVLVMPVLAAIVPFHARCYEERWSTEFRLSPPQTYDRGSSADISAAAEPDHPGESLWQTPTVAGFLTRTPHDPPHYGHASSAEA